MIREKVKAALESTNIQVCWNGWKGQGLPPARYFTFTTINYPGNHSEDKQDERIHAIYLDLFSTTDYDDLIETIRNRMLAQGFNPGEEQDVPEQSGYHLSMTWFFTEVI